MGQTRNTALHPAHHHHQHNAARYCRKRPGRGPRVEMGRDQGYHRVRRTRPPEAKQRDNREVPRAQEVDHRLGHEPVHATATGLVIRRATTPGRRREGPQLAHAVFSACQRLPVQLRAWRRAPCSVVQDRPARPFPRQDRTRRGPGTPERVPAGPTSTAVACECGSRGLVRELPGAAERCPDLSRARAAVLPAELLLRGTGARHRRRDPLARLRASSLMASLLI